MRFVRLSPSDALGSINVHTLRAGTRVIKKGRVLRAEEIAALVAAGISSVVCAQLEPGELEEDAAAAQVATALAGPHVIIDPAHTGRANLRAASAGVLLVDRDAIGRVNLLDEAITVATVAPELPVRAGDFIATVKIIPFAVSGAAVRAASDTARVISVAPFQQRRVGLLLTRFTATHERVLDRASQTQRTRLERIGSVLASERRVSHAHEAIEHALVAMAGEGLDTILVMGASAIVDRRDVIPAALESAGGSIVRYGMPVDPGNLLLLGNLGDVTVIGLPGCARSLERSGFDWVLERTCAGLSIAAETMAALGVGGLIVDAPRLAPITRTDQTPSGIAAVILAAGRSSRMGSNKLLAELDGEPLVRHAVKAALASRVHAVVVVTGNDAERVHAALDGLAVRFVHNPDFASGMASSLRTGVAAVRDARAAMICLGDMPRVTSTQLDRLASVFEDTDDDHAIVVPMFQRKRGNPVVLGRAYFEAVDALTGDVGARSLIERNPSRVQVVELEDAAILVDVDTPERLAELRDEASST